MRIKNLLSIEDLSKEDISFICKSAVPRFKALEKGTEVAKKASSRRGPAIGLVFLEPSTRTRASFERAAQILGRSTILIESKGSSVEKGESLEDTVLTLKALGVGVFVIRTPRKGGLNALLRLKAGPILNAGDGTGEHPTQALADLATLTFAMKKATRGDPKLLKGFRMGIVGDLRHSRVARSWALLAKKIGIELSLLSPPTWKPEDWGSDLPWTADRKDFFTKLDAVMALRVQKERIADLSDGNLTSFSQGYQVRAADLKEGQWLLHPGPTNWGMELEESLVDLSVENPRSLIRKQVRMGLAVRSVLLGALENG